MVDDEVAVALGCFAAKVLGHAKPNNVARPRACPKHRLGTPSLNAVIEDRDSSSSVQSMNQGMHLVVIVRL